MENIDSLIEHFQVPIVKAQCRDGIVRTGKITTMPFIGNEHQHCTMQTFDKELHQISIRRVIETLGKDPRRF